MNNDKFFYQDENELKVVESICELCINYNDGKRNEKCPKELINKIIKGKADCPNFEEPSFFDRIEQIDEQ